MEAEQARLFRKVSLRVALPLIVLYVIAFLDRVNVSFAALTMNRDLGIDERWFGVAAGIFFIGYMLFAVPSNVALKRFGPRAWLTFLMVTWGVVSGALSFVHSVRGYVLLRFLLGAAEAGFFPGIVYYLTRWLPAKARGGILGLFMFSIPLSSIIGSPISAKLLQMDGAGGLHGWQWMFLLEALPAVVFGAMIPVMLTASPELAGWLTAEEKLMLREALAEDDMRAAQSEGHGEAVPLPYGRIAFAAVIYFMYAVALYALGFWVPKLLASHGVRLAVLGWVSAAPFVVGGVSMLLWTRWADATGGHLRHFSAAMLTGAVGFACAAVAPSAGLVVAGLAIAAVGVYASLPIWWAGFSQKVSAAHAAVAIAIVNSVGNMGGFAGPPVIGWLTLRTHSYVAALVMTGVCCVIGAGLATVLAGGGVRGEADPLRG